jgi:hypothetical protein
MMLDGRLFYFTSAANIRQYLEVYLKEVMVQKRYRKGGKEQLKVNPMLTDMKTTSQGEVKFHT